MSNSNQNIDWNYWLAFPYVKAWEAVLLSLNLDPDGMSHSPHGWMAGPGGGPIFEKKSFPSAEIADEWRKRLKLLIGNLSNRAIFSPGILNMADPTAHRVRLPEFAAWLLELKRPHGLPSELERIARGPSEAPTSELAQKSGLGEAARAKPQGWRRRDILATIRKLGETPNNLPPRPPDAKGWVKSKVWNELHWPKDERGAFDSQWQAMRREGEIAERDSADPPS